MERKPQEGPLQGIRILDLTRLYPGPLGTMMLADMGADVIKIEDVNAPDYMRFYPPYIKSESAGFVAVNRSKRSLALNLKTPKGVGLFLSLVKTADIVIEQFRPGVLDEMGIGYNQARQVKEDIIYVSITGYGQYGPYAKTPDTTSIISGTPVSFHRPAAGKPAPPPRTAAGRRGGRRIHVYDCVSECPLGKRKNRQGPAC